jgi:hypothetical protein
LPDPQESLELQELLPDELQQQGLAWVQAVLTVAELRQEEA